MSRKIGAVWRGKMKENGATYFYGEIEIVAGIKTKIALFPKRAEEGKILNPKAPAYEIVVSEPSKDAKVIETAKDIGGD